MPTPRPPPFPTTPPPQPQERRSRGWFRVVKRKGNLWDIYFKNFHSDTMLCIVSSLEQEVANQLKDQLNFSLSQIDPPDTFTGLDIHL